MRKQLMYVAFVGGVALAAASYAVAPEADEGGPRQFSARLDGYQEAPAVSSTGHGLFTARLVDEEGPNPMIEYELSYAELEGTTTSAAHIHLGQRGVAGGVSAFLCGGGGKPACPATATDDPVSGTIVAADVIGPTAQGIAPGEFGELVRGLRAGVTYANVHTNKHPGGEIRGQIRDSNQRDSDR